MSYVATISHDMSLLWSDDSGTFKKEWRSLKETDTYSRYDLHYHCNETVWKVYELWKYPLEVKGNRIGLVVTLRMIRWSEWPAHSFKLFLYVIFLLKRILNDKKIAPVDAISIS